MATITPKEACKITRRITNSFFVSGDSQTKQEQYSEALTWTPDMLSKMYDIMQLIEDDLPSPYLYSCFFATKDSLHAIVRPIRRWL